jgi:preprotein translocase subunit SecY
MSKFIETLSKLGEVLPTVAKPKQKVSLSRKILWSIIAVVIYLLMASIPLYGLQGQNFQNFLLQQVIFASSAGTLAQLGIGPIITSGLIMQILVGSKIIQLNLNNPEDRSKFTLAQKGLSLIFIIIESALFAYALTRSYENIILPLVVFLQLVIATYLILLLDELVQKGWGLGSGISLFILAGVSKIMFWDLFGIAYVQSQNLPIGFFPSLIDSLITGGDLSNIIINTSKLYQPDLIGLITTFVLIFLLIYLTNMTIDIPITTQRLRGIKRTIPLNFLYVSSIPVIFVSILGADFQLFASIASYINPSYYNIINEIASIFSFPSPNSNLPRSIYAVVLDPIHAIVFSIVFIILCLLFGRLWIDVAGLDPASQARNMVEAGLEIPGMRSNPKIIESILAKYIYPLTFFSSLIVGLIAVMATLLGAYGSGVGILLAVTISIQYYSLLAYERTLETYPLLRRLVGE